MESLLAINVRARRLRLLMQVSDNIAEDPAERGQVCSLPDGE